MAGAGAKLFTAGSVLTAAEVNTFLMDQAIMRFATTTDRTNAFGGAGEPTLAEGMFSYIDADNTLYYYTGSAWEKIAVLDDPSFTTGIRINTSSRYTASGISGPLSSLAGTTSAAGYGVSIWSNNTTGPNNLFLKSRGTTIGTHGAVVSGDVLGRIVAGGSDGTAFYQSAEVRANADATPTSGVVPGRIGFFTTNSSGTVTEALRADSLQNVGVNGGAGGDRLRVTDPDASGYSFHSLVTDTSYAGSAIAASASRAANAAYNFFVAVSDVNGTPDTEFALKGDGNGYCDGAWTGGGADFAECFEWLDGNPENEDRRGWAVVVVGDKIKKAENGDKPIGVVSSSPSFISDAAWNEWKLKYVRDEFGDPILETKQLAEWQTEDGIKQAYIDSTNQNEIPEDARITTVQVKKLNPNYDPDVVYIPRLQRKEWSPIGLLGKLLVKKTEITSPEWIKLSDVSDELELWLIK